MEKRTPHCKLSVVQRLIQANRVRATATAYRDASGLGIPTLSGMCDVVMSLTTKDFYKSMTTNNDHTVWQDVYHAKTPGGTDVYLKLTVMNDVLIVSFKELEP